MYVVIVTASRTRNGQADRAALRLALDRVLARHEPLTVRHGACPGSGDEWAGQWAAEQRAAGRKVEADPMPAAWRPGGRFDRAAGFKRNAAMVGKGADECVALAAVCELERCAGLFPHPTHGAGDCMARARAARIMVTEV